MPDANLALIVDDDAAQRMPVRLVLERAGYRVLEAWDLLSAVDQYQKQACRFTAMIMDFNMPGASGLDVYDAIKQRCEYFADIKKILFSAQTKPMEAWEYRRMFDLDVQYVEKDIRGLREIIRILAAR